MEKEIFVDFDHSQGIYGYDVAVVMHANKACCRHVLYPVGDERAKEIAVADAAKMVLLDAENALAWNEHLGQVSEWIESLPEDLD